MPLQAVQVMMDEQREELTKSHLPEATVPEMSAKEMQVGELPTTFNDTNGPILCGWQPPGQHELYRMEGGNLSLEHQWYPKHWGPVLKDLSEQNKSRK